MARIQAAARVALVAATAVNRVVMSNRCKATTNNRTVEYLLKEQKDNNPYTMEYI